MPGLGRIHVADGRDARYPLTAALATPNPTPPQARDWGTGAVLDQGETPECVAFAWKQWLDSQPQNDPQADPPQPLDIYTKALTLDGISGQHAGTTVRAGAQVLQGMGKINTYHWSTSVLEVKQYVLTTGPVVLGTDWYEAMFTPDASGLVVPSGSVAGGHAYLCIGFDQTSDLFKCVNSWGTSWGQSGCFYLHEADLNGLLNADGEACSAVNASATQPVQ